MKKLLGSCLLYSTAVGVTLLGFTIGVRAQTPADEISPPVSALLFGLERMMGSDSILVETALEGFADKYGDAVKQEDHVQGMTMTASGRIVLSYSRQNFSSEDCKGMLVYSSPFDPANPNKELDWDFYCETINTDPTKGSIGYGPEGHPSTLQASGNILAVGTHRGTRFYYLGSNGIESLHPNTAITFAVEDSAGVRQLDSNGNQIFGRDATGLVYNHIDNRFYLLNAAGTVTPNETSFLQLCRSAQNISLRQAQSAVFTDCKIIDDVYVSGQGSNLVMQEDGIMYLVSAFSTTEEPKGGWGSYGTLCNLSRASPLTPAVSDIFDDQLYVTQLDYAAGTAKKVYNENLEKTQYDPCVHHRPSFRFAGAVATSGNGDLLGLWSGRQNPPVLSLGDSFEFAFQDLPQPAKGASVSEAKAYLFRENDTYYRYTDDQGVDPGYPASTSKNWDFEVESDDKEILGAVRYDNDHVYLFLEDGYYSRLEKDGSTSSGYPVKITESNWPGLAPHAEDIKAVINWGNGFVYFFLDDSAFAGRFKPGEYIRYNIAENRIDQEPQPVKGNWGILGDYNDDISAAVNWGNGKAYFFIEGGKYIRWDINTNEVGGPAEISKYWRGVSDDEDITAAFRHRR